MKGSHFPDSRSNSDIQSTPLYSTPTRPLCPANRPGFTRRFSLGTCVAPALSGGPFRRRRRTTPSRNRQHASTHAPHAARSSPANPFLESPADSGTRAPNFRKLRQSGDARQDLVRISESTTKCGDYGEESGGDAEVSKIRGESERALRA